VKGHVKLLSGHTDTHRYTHTHTHTHTLDRLLYLDHWTGL